MPVEQNDAPRRREAGFTLVEAVVLIALLGILAAVAVPRFSSVSELDAIRAHRQALSDLRFAAQLASASGCPVAVDFAPDHYTLRRRSGCRTGAFSQAVRDPTTGRAPYEARLPSGTTVSSDVDPLVFDALGRTTTSAGVVTDAEITIGTRRLSTVGETGLVHVP